MEAKLGRSYLIIEKGERIKLNGVRLVKLMLDTGFCLELAYTIFIPSII